MEESLCRVYLTDEFDNVIKYYDVEKDELFSNMEYFEKNFTFEKKVKCEFDIGIDNIEQVHSFDLLFEYLNNKSLKPLIFTEEQYLDTILDVVTVADYFGYTSIIDYISVQLISFTKDIINTLNLFLNNYPELVYKILSKINDLELKLYCTTNKLISDICSDDYLYFLKLEYKYHDDEKPETMDNKEYYEMLKFENKEDKIKKLYHFIENFLLNEKYNKLTRNSNWINHDFLSDIILLTGAKFIDNDTLELNVKYTIYYGSRGHKEFYMDLYYDIENMEFITSNSFIASNTFTDPNYDMPSPSGVERYVRAYIRVTKLIYSLL